MKRKKLNVAVLMGGPSREHEVSLHTGKEVIRALPRGTYNLLPVIIPKRGVWILPPKVDVAFIAMHGTYGEDGTVQGYLEMEGVPYTGSGILASALAMDKIRSSYLYMHYGLTVPEFTVISSIDKKFSVKKFPMVVKPASSGSSVGVSIVKRKSDLRGAVRKALRVSPRAMLQEYIDGVEVSCGVLDSGAKKIAFPPVQIIPQSGIFYDYRAKYAAGGSAHVIPPKLPKNIIKNIRSAALKAHEVLGCAGMSRTDMIVRGKKIYMLETNTIPGMTETSLYPQAAAAIGISFPELLERIIRAAQANKKKA